MKLKYIEEKYPPYFTFENSTDLVHNLTNVNGEDIALSVMKKDAERLISDREELLLAIHDLCNLLEETDETVFKGYWYGH